MMALSQRFGKVPIVDIRHGRGQSTLRKDLLSQLKSVDGKQRRFPNEILYDETGLKIFEEITNLEEYYLEQDEKELYSQHADEIAHQIPGGAQLLELGSGNFGKINMLLQALERQKKSVAYYALDLDRNELERSFAQVRPKDFSHVTVHGLHGTYDDAQRWLRECSDQYTARYIAMLGSSLGQASPAGAADFLRSFALLLKPRGAIIIGLDGTTDGDKIYKAFNDRKGVTHRFYRNALDNANVVLGYEAFKQAAWDLITEYDRIEGCHKTYFAPKEDVVVDGALFPKGERVLLETAYVFPPKMKRGLFAAAGVVSTRSFTSSNGTFCKYSQARFLSADEPRL